MAASDACRRRRWSGGGGPPAPGPTAHPDALRRSLNASDASDVARPDASADGCHRAAGDHRCGRTRTLENWLAGDVRRAGRMPARVALPGGAGRCWTAPCTPDAVRSAEQSVDGSAGAGMDRRPVALFAALQCGGRWRRSWVGGAGAAELRGGASAARSICGSAGFAGSTGAAGTAARRWRRSRPRSAAAWRGCGVVTRSSGAWLARRWLLRLGRRCGGLRHLDRLLAPREQPELLLPLASAGAGGGCHRLAAPTALAACSRRWLHRFSAASPRRPAGLRGALRSSAESPSAHRRAWRCATDRSSA